MSDRKFLVHWTVMLLMFCAALWATTETESNDSTGAANPITLSELIASTNVLQGEMSGGMAVVEGPGTNDYFKFFAQSGDRISISLDQAPSTLQAYLYLLNPSSINVASDTNGPADNRISDYVATATGNYFINLTYVSGSGNYDLAVVVNKDGFNEAETFNTNDNSASAELIPAREIVSGNLELVPFSGVIDPGEEDWYYLYLRESQQVEITIKPSANLSVKLDFYDDTLSLLNSDTSVSDGNPAVLPTTTTTYAGYHYVKVSSVSGNGIYAQYVMEGSLQGNVSYTYEFEPNDSTGASNEVFPTELFSGSNIFKTSVTGSLGLKETTATNDYYKFYAEAGDRISLTLDQLDSGMGAYLYLLNPSSINVASDTNSVADNRVSDYIATVSGNYFVNVTHVSNSGVYDLSILINRNGFNEAETFGQNNSTAGAEIIPAREVVSGNLQLTPFSGVLDNGDEDWYYLYLRENQTINLSLRVSSGLSGNLTILDDMGAPLASGFSATPGDPILLNNVSTSYAGYYYLQLNALDGDGYHAHYVLEGNLSGNVSYSYEIEPNDNNGSSNEVFLTELFPSSNIFKTSVTGTLGLKEAVATNDYFMFYAEAGDRITLTLDQLDAGMGAYLYLQNPSAINVASDTNSGADNRVSDYIATVSGNHFVYITHVSNSGVYDLSIIINKDGFNEAEQFSQNDGTSGAEIIPAREVVAGDLALTPFFGSLDNGDEDWYYLYLREDQVINLSLRPTLGLSANVTLRDDTGTELAGGSSMNPGDPVLLNNISTTYAGYYYVQLNAIDGSGYHAHYVLEGSLQGNVSYSYEFEPNDNNASANEVFLSELFPSSNIFKTSVTGTLGLKEATATNDYFMFYAEAGDRITLTLDQLDAGMGAYLYLQNPSSINIASDTNSAADNRVSDYIATVSGNHFVYITHVSNVGVYDLSIVINKDGFNEAERFSQNNFISGAEIIPAREVISGNLELTPFFGTLDPGEDDWYYLYLREDQVVNLSVRPTNGLSANIVVRDSMAVELGSGMSMNPGDPIFLNNLMTNDAGYYYIQINAIDGDGYHSHYVLEGSLAGNVSYSYEFESNDSNASANEVMLAELFPSSNVFKTSVTGTLGLKETTTTNDYFKFYVEAGDRITLTLDQLDSGMGAYLYLQNPSSINVASDTNSVADNRVSDYIATVSGNHFAYITHVSGSGVYDMNIVVNKDGFNEEETFGQNNTFAGAELVPVLRASGNETVLMPYIGVIDNNDEDYFFLYLRENQQLNLSLITTGGFQAEFELTGPDSSTLAINTASMSGETVVLPPVLSTEPGYHYLRVRGISGNGYHAHYLLEGTLISDLAHTNELENNDSIGAANDMELREILPGLGVFKGTVTGSMGLKEPTATNDYFRFYAEIGDRLTLTLNQLDSGFGAYLYLQNSSSITVASDTNSAADNRISDYIVPSSGNYHMFISHVSGSGVYEAQVVRNVVGVNEKEKFTTNDSFASAEHIITENGSGVSHISTLSGVLDNGDVDYYQISLFEGEEVQLALTSENGTLYPAVEFLAPNGNLITSASNGQELFLMANAEDGPGNYGLKIAEVSGAGYHSQYTLNGNILGSSRYSEEEPNDTFLTSNEITSLGIDTSTGSVIHEIGATIGIAETTSTDDYYTFYAESGDNVNLYLDQMGALSLYLYFINPQGSTISSDTNSANDNQLLSQGITVSGNYGVRVARVSGTGAYTLRIEREVDVPTIVELTPADGASQVSLSGNLSIVFDRDINLGTSGLFQIRDVDQQLIHSSFDASVPSPGIVVSGNKLTIELQTPLADKTNYDIISDPSFIVSVEGDEWFGLGTVQEWHFSTGKPIRLAAGRAHSLAMDSSGEVWGFGDYSLGQLGSSSTSSVSVILPGPWNKVAAGEWNSLALDASGQVVSFGNGDYGQLARTGSSFNPSPTPSVEGFTTMEASGSHILAVDESGRLWSSGRNRFGQLGVGDLTDRMSWTQVGTNTDWNEVSVGADFSLAINNSGQLYSWGSQGWLQLGHVSSTSPQLVNADTDWAAISAGYRHVLALKSDGTLWAWGDNQKGQLGTGDSISRSAPIQIATGIESISAGAFYSLAINTSGQLLVWGSNRHGQLGLGDLVDRLSPTVQPTGFNWVDIEAGPFHALGYRSDNSLWAWGLNTSQQVQDGGPPKVMTPSSVW